MIEDIINAFSLKRDIFVSPEDAASIIEAVGLFIDNDHIKDNRVARLPERLSQGDLIGEYAYIPLTILDVSISLAIDQKLPGQTIMGSTLSKISSLSNTDMLLCKINRKDLAHKDFGTVCLIHKGIPNFRARCEGIVAMNDHPLEEISRFTKSKNFNVEVLAMRDEEKWRYHKFTFASQNGKIELHEKSMISVLKKYADSIKHDFDVLSHDPVKVASALISVDVNKNGLSELLRYMSGGNKIVNVGSKVVAKPTNLMKSKSIGTVVGKSANVINVKWDAGFMKYNLDDPKTYFLIEFVD